MTERIELEEGIFVSPKNVPKTSNWLNFFAAGVGQSAK
jgi:hypothetical protein